MAELVLGAVLSLLFKRLTSPELLKFAKREKVGDLVNKWETKLCSISVLLEDAEDKAMRGSDGRVQPWLDDLKDLVYDIEDVVDEFVTQEAIRGLEKKAAAGTSTGKVCSLIPSCCSGLSPRKLIVDHKLRSRMEKIDGRLSFILEQKRELGLSEGSRLMNRPNYSERLTTSLPESYVVGRQDDERAILTKLLSKTGDQHLAVIPIVGMGGVGKTTLARSVFNNSDVVEAFPQRGWACVSDNFNMVEIARALLGSLGGTADSSDLNVLHNKLGEILSKQKCLIVLDDYWNENYNDWVRLSDLFMLGVKGSKIIVTTRLDNVASLMKTSPTYHSLRVLSPSDCRSLLAYHALGGSSFDSHPLKPIGEKIAEKCGGLPLAAKTLGGLLRSKSSSTEWQYILDSEIWNLPQGRDGILPALKLSYFHLPSYAKRCFTFCAIFPQDYEFDRDELVQLWTAEGLVYIDPHMPRRSMRDQGLQQFDVLLSRSFFQRSSQNESRFVMHDLMHDLATSVGGITYLNVGLGEFDVGKAAKSLEKVRHLSYIPKNYEICTRLEKCRVFKGLRTFLALPSPKQYLSNKVAEELFHKLKCIRTLSFGGYSINKIPGSVCYLKHLRYLNFSGCSIRELPETICTLYNLETLILKGCHELTELPQGINKLINLRCLDIKGTSELKNMPVGLGHLHKLEILPKFIVGKEGGLRLSELKCFQFLQKDLLISDLQNVEDIGDARDAELISMVGLTAVTFEWNDDSNSRSDDKEMQVLNLLQPHLSIEEVKIHGFGGISFPQWIGSRLSLVSIKRLLLSKCRTTMTLPSLGLLPSLRELKIDEMDAVCTVGPEFFGTAERPFPSLEVLEFENMRAWESWSFSFGDKKIDQPFPRLNQLVLKRCPKLVSDMPHQLCSLVRLDVKYCPLLEASPCMASLPLLQELSLADCRSSQLASISLANLNTLTKITLSSMKSELLYLNEDFLSSLSVVEVLDFDSCDGLIWLWEDNDAEVGTSLARLRRLSIRKCYNLQKLPNDMQRLTSLRKLYIDECSKLESLQEGMMSCTNLEMLVIERCGSLICLAKDAMLPSTLRNLHIHECEKFERLPEGIITVINNGQDNGDFSTSSNNAMISQLEQLAMSHCPSLKPLINNSQKKQARMSLKRLEMQNCGNAFDWLLEDGDEEDDLGRVYASLEYVKIQDCNVKSITHCLDHVFPNLTRLELWNCPYLEVEVFPQLPSCLKSLELIKCKKIKSLPHLMQTTSSPSSLQKLTLSDLSIETLFPMEGGLPRSLEFLEIRDCKELRQPMTEWGLDKLTALKTLNIKAEIGCLQGMTCFPPPPPPFPSPAAHVAASNWSVLPPNLEELTVYFQQEMVSLSNGLRDHLTSLKVLSINYNPKLQILPKEGFPPSIEYLQLTGYSQDLDCKLSSNGEYFPLIERIPYVRLRY